MPRLKLAAKLCLILSGVAAALLASVLLPLYHSENERLRGQIESGQAEAVQQFAQVCADSLARQDPAERLSYLKTLILLSEPGMVEYAMLVDDRGAVLLHSDFAHGDESLRGRILSDPRMRRALDAREGTRQALAAVELLSAPLYETSPSGRSRRAGTAVIAYRRSAVEAALRATRVVSADRVARLAWPGVCLAVLIALGFGRALSRPIAAMEAGARAIGEGRLDVRIPAERSDELGVLAREFNAMAVKLAELEKLKDSFLSQITHDLGNPLAAIIACVDTLMMGAKGAVNEGQATTLRVIQSNADYLSSLIGDILDITKLEAGRLKLKAEPVELTDLARAVLELMKPKADEYRVALESRVPDGSVVWADEQALRRVLVNLISNALKFTPGGGRVALAYSTRPEGDRIEVSDTGIGIPGDRLPGIFQKFFQVEETKNKVREARGTGLGLVICKQFVEAHGGTIGVRSVFREGTTVFFMLPRPAVLKDHEPDRGSGIVAT